VAIAPRTMREGSPSVQSCAVATKAAATFGAKRDQGDGSCKRAMIRRSRPPHWRPCLRPGTLRRKTEVCLRLGPSMLQSFVRLVAGGLAGPVFFALAAPGWAAERVQLDRELERLSQDHGFAIRGLEKTQSVSARADGDDLLQRLRALLEGFDHVIVQGAQGKVERVIVLGAKVPFEPPPLELPPGRDDAGEVQIETIRRGAARLVRVALAGTDGVRIDRELQVDTGADFLVLPLSIAKALGVDTGTLEARELQTANGKVQAGVGILSSLWLGEHRIDQVPTAFLEDAKLGNSGLLGMSVLGRYKLTMDDDNNRIILNSRADGDVGEPDAEEVELHQR